MRLGAETAACVDVPGRLEVTSELERALSGGHDRVDPREGRSEVKRLDMERMLACLFLVRTGRPFKVRIHQQRNVTVWNCVLSNTRVQHRIDITFPTPCHPAKSGPVVDEPQAAAVYLPVIRHGSMPRTRGVLGHSHSKQCV